MKHPVYKDKILKELEDVVFKPKENEKCDMSKFLDVI
jgi:hypothetical protein